MKQQNDTTEHIAEFKRREIEKQSDLGLVYSIQAKEATGDPLTDAEIEFLGKMRATEDFKWPTW